MTRPEQIAFNLIFNSTCSFFAGIFVVVIAVKLFRIGNSHGKLFLLSLPFVKIIWDIARGIPASSVIFSGINPLALPPRNQMLTIGAGLSEYGPIFNLQFTAHDLAGKAHATSFADYVAALLMKYFHPSAPRLVLIAALTASTILLGRRLILAAQFESQRKEQRAQDRSIGRVQLRYRTVDLYCSSAYTGTPFTGGVLRPYICFPENAYRALSDAEREAVIQHEIAHIRHWDLLATLTVKVLCDVFWFMPFYRLLSKRIDRLREILADRVAVRLGASGTQLATALIKLKEAPLSTHQPLLYSAFFREPSLLKTRVGELLETVSRLRKNPVFG